MLVLLLLLNGGGTAWAQSATVGLLVHGQSGKCIESWGSRSTGTVVSPEECQPFNVNQQWRRQGNTINSYRTDDCLTSNGMEDVYKAYCGESNNPYQQWITEGRLLRHAASGQCLSSYGYNLHLSPCNNSNQNLTWDFGAKVTQGALNCKISDSQYGYSNDYGSLNLDPANPLSFAKAPFFTLGRLGWGARQIDEVYLVQRNSDGLCVSRTGYGERCDPNNLNQHYRIKEAAGGVVIKRWQEIHVKFNPLTSKPIVDVFGNPNKPLAKTLLKNPGIKDDLSINLLRNRNMEIFGVGLGVDLKPGIENTVVNNRPPSIECATYSDSSAALNKLSVTENYLLAAKYAQQESAKTFRDLRRSALTTDERNTVVKNISDIRDVGSRTLKLYDFMAETQGDLSIKYLRSGAPSLITHGLVLLNDLVTESRREAFAEAVISASRLPLEAMQRGIDRVPLHAVRGRSLMETGGLMSGQMSVQMRVPWALPNDVTKIRPYLASHGNFRISFPGVGHLANTAGGGSDPNHSFSNYATNKADGVFNFVVTIELDKNLWTASRAFNPLLPQIDGGVEYHFAMSYRAGTAAGDRLRVDSISINTVVDVATQGGIVKLGSRIKNIMDRNRIVPMLVAETQMSGGRPFGMTSNNFDNIDLIQPRHSASTLPAIINTSYLDDSILSVSQFWTDPVSFTSSVLNLGDSQLGQEVHVIMAVVEEMNKVTSFKQASLIGGLLNVVLEAGVGVKWFNRSFLSEIGCRYDNPTDPACKSAPRKFLDFRAQPSVIELTGMGIFSSQVNLSWENLKVPFFKDLNPTIGLALPRVQYSATANYWTALTPEAAKAMKAGASQATQVAK